MPSAPCRGNERDSPSLLDLPVSSFPALQIQPQQTPSQEPAVPVALAVATGLNVSIARLRQEDPPGCPTQPAGSPDPPKAVGRLEQLLNAAWKNSTCSNPRGVTALPQGQSDPQPLFQLCTSYFSQSPAQHGEGQVVWAHKDVLIPAMQKSPKGGWAGVCLQKSRRTNLV